MRQDDGSGVGATFDLEKPIYFEELRRTIPLKIILSGLSEHQLRLLNLHEVEGLNDEQIGKQVNERPAVVRYEIQAIKVAIRTQIKALSGK